MNENPAAAVTLLRWFEHARRDLPWRARPGEAVEPYRVLVSEIMLQQTTVATVASRFDGFIERFPTIAALADAPLDDVLHAWQGLGYYRRARSLQQAAMVVRDRHAGRLPASPDQLMRLPGIGRYTAAAIAAIAFDRQVVPVDGNVARIISRLCALDAVWPQKFAAFQRHADGWFRGARPGDRAQALMDLGAMICRPQRPRCVACPLADHCLAAARGTPQAFPVKAAKPVRPERYAAAFLLQDGHGRILLRRRPPQGLLAGLVELPCSPWHDRPFATVDAASRDAPPGATGLIAVAGGVRHVFTHLALNLLVLRGSAEGCGDGFWHHPSALDRLALPTLTRKLLRHAGVAA